VAAFFVSKKFYSGGNHGSYFFTRQGFIEETSERVSWGLCNNLRWYEHSASKSTAKSTLPAIGIN